MLTMASTERRADLGNRRGRQLVVQLGEELREARIGAGLSQRQVAEAAGVSHAQVGRVERGEILAVSLVLVARLLAVVGLRLAARAFPAGPPLRDGAHVALLKRLHAELPAGVRFTTEVPLRSDREGRAWDAGVDLADGTLRVEAETRIRDLQALDRRVALKQRDDGVERVILLVSDTKTNRAVIRAGKSLLCARYPLSGRAVLRALRAGTCPKAGGIVLL